MRQGGLIWGVLLLMGGILFLLDNLGFLPISALSLFFPLVLILIGLWFLVGPIVFRQAVETRELVIPNNGSSEAVIKIRHGAGAVKVGSMAGSSNILEGTFAGGVDEKIERNGSTTEVKLRVPEMEWFGFPSLSTDRGFEWNINLCQSMAYMLDVQTGASRNHFDLRDLIITDVKMDQGANDTLVILPSQAGFTRGNFHFGSARLELQVPENVAAQIKIDGALLDTKEIDTTRFPQSGGLFCSPDYATATNRVEINIEAGVGKIVIR